MLTVARQWAYTCAVSVHAAKDMDETVRRIAERKMRAAAQRQGVTLGAVTRATREEFVMLPEPIGANGDLAEVKDMPVVLAEQLGVDITGLPRLYHDRYVADVIEE